MHTGAFVWLERYCTSLFNVDIFPCAFAAMIYSHRGCSEVFIELYFDHSFSIVYSKLLT